MCLFPRKNTNEKGRAFQLGVEYFDCGVCPECLAKKSRLWALRCSAESQYNPGVMVTLTYDDYKYLNGRIVGELPPKKLLCNVRHCQLFIKRLRKWSVDNLKRKKILLKNVLPRIEKKATRIVRYLPKNERSTAKKRIVYKEVQKIKDKNRRIAEYNHSLSQCSNVKYLLTAEHGSRTGRAHYHAILFGVNFKDKVQYKRSKRGNLIYKSATLTKLWSHGICTIDAVNITGKVARYCTKYCAKDSRCADTFMLMSRGIGDKWLLENFNAKSYILDGVEYPVPKLIWNKYIEEKYKDNCIFKRIGVTYKYRSFDWYLSKIPNISYNSQNIQIAKMLSDFQKKKNLIFSKFKRMNARYKDYLNYWKNKSEIYKLNQPSELDRILALPDDKYFAYKQAAVRAKFDEITYRRCLVPRGSRKELRKFRFCPFPLVNKGQMTPKKDKKNFKTAFFVKSVQKIVYLRPYRVR